MSRLPRGILLSLLALAALTLVGCKKSPQPAVADNIEYYTCPMHPSVKAHKPGACPLCGMDLVPVYRKTATAQDPVGSASGSAMPPDAGHASHGMPVADQGKTETASVTPETSGFQVSPERLQAIGVRTGTVTKQMLHRSLRAPGIVVIDEGTLRDISLKAADGFIEQLYANVTGQTVRKGQPLALILSEGWIEAQQNYINAYRSWQRTRQFQANENPVMLQQEFDRFRARLRVWDLSDEQIKQLEDVALRSSETSLLSRPGAGKGLSGFFELRSPMTGIVVGKAAVAGMKFAQGQQLFRLASLNPIWVDVDFPEDQAPYVALGQEFQINIPALANRTWTAKADFIYPQFSNETRRLKVRFVLANPDLKILPGMYANAGAAVPLGEKLTVPYSAVVPTGDRYVVFLDHGGGKLEPRFVELGEKLGDDYEVLGGLQEGDRIITSATFLIDSESRLQGALQTWGQGPQKH